MNSRGLLHARLLDELRDGLLQVVDAGAWRAISMYLLCLLSGGLAAPATPRSVSMS